MLHRELNSHQRNQHSALWQIQQHSWSYCNFYWFIFLQEIKQIFKRKLSISHCWYHYLFYISPKPKFILSRTTISSVGWLTNHQKTRNMEVKIQWLIEALYYFCSKMRAFSACSITRKQGVRMKSVVLACSSPVTGTSRCYMQNLVVKSQWFNYYIICRVNILLTPSQNADY
jgi:hypothetical protein